MADSKNIINNKYKLGNLIGVGNYGSVYSAQDVKDNNKLYAIKQIKKKKMETDYLQNALKKEVNIMLLLDHENSVRLLDYFETEEYYNLIMELCDTDLEELLKDHFKKTQKGFNELELWAIMNQLNKIFKKMREKCIIHRDLKLKNIMVKKDEKIDILGFVIKLSDFGFSKVLQDEDITSTQLGTPATQAPEIQFGHDYNKKADLWSIGIIIYQLLFHKLPFVSKKKTELKREIYNWNSVVLPQDNNNPITETCFDLINRLLQKDPNKRIDFDDYFKHKFFSNQHKAKLIEKMNQLNEENNKKEKEINTNKTPDESKDENIKKDEKKEKKVEIKEILDFDKKYKKLNPLKEYDGFILYKGRDLINKKNVIIKEISRAIIDKNEKNKKLFERELELLSSLKGKQFPEFFGLSKTDSHYYLIIEYFSGKNFDDFINSNPKYLDKSFTNFIFSQMKPSFLEIKEKKIILPMLTPKSFAFSYYQSENNFEIKFFDYGLHSIFLEEINKNNSNPSFNQLTFNFEDYLNSNFEENKNLNNLDKKEPIIKDEEIEQIFEIMEEKLNNIYKYFNRKFSNKENILENEIYDSYYKEFVIFLFFSSLECQTIINFLKIGADTDIIDKTNQEIHAMKINMNKFNIYHYSNINFVDESNNKNYLYNKENPSFDYYLNIFIDLKKKIDDLYVKLNEINGKNLSNEKDNGKLNNSTLTLISKSELVNTDDIDKKMVIGNKCIEQCLREGNIDNLFMKILDNILFYFSYGRKTKIDNMVDNELKIAKYLIEYIIFINAIFGNKNKSINFDKIFENNVQEKEFLFATFLGGKIKDFKDKGILEYKGNYYNSNEIYNKEYEKMISLYIKITKLIDRRKIK